MCEGYAFCSSATGALYLPLNAISDQTDLSRDLRLLSGTPLQPGKPVFALWLRNPQSVQSCVLATVNINLAPLDYPADAPSVRAGGARRPPAQSLGALIYLEKYPFDYLKIDRGFVQSISTQTLNSPVLDTVLHLAKKLNLKTAAEGVEKRANRRPSW